MGGSGTIGVAPVVPVEDALVDVEVVEAPVVELVAVVELVVDDELPEVDEVAVDELPTVDAVDVPVVEPRVVEPLALPVEAEDWPDDDEALPAEPLLPDVGGDELPEDEPSPRVCTSCSQPARASTLEAITNSRMQRKGRSVDELVRSATAMILPGRVQLWPRHFRRSKARVSSLQSRSVKLKRSFDVIVQPGNVERQP